MSTILKLFKLQVDNKSDFLKAKNLKKMFFSFLKLFLIIFALTTVFNFIFFRIFILGFKINQQLIALVLLVTQLISLLFAIGSIISNLYFSKDNELLMVLPATPNQIFISKILVIYAQELLVNTIITLPLLLALGKSGAMPLAYYVSMPIMLLILPILPIVVASFVSIPVMMFIKFLKKHLVLNIIVILLLVAVAMSAYMFVIQNITDNFNIVSRQIETVKQINAAIFNVGSNLFLYTVIAGAMLSFSKWYWILIFLFVCAAAMAVTVLIIRPFYFKTAMSNLENSVKDVIKPKEYASNKPFTSLLKREFFTVFRSPGYIFQYFLFTILMPFIVFSYDKLMLSIAVSQAGQNMIAGSHVLVVAILAMLSNVISASAVSREGGNFYISKITPVNYYTQIFAKLTFNSIFTVGALIVTMFISMFYLNDLQVLLGTIAILFASIGHIALSIDIDIKNPNLHWYINEESSKMDANTTKSMVYGLLIALLMGAIVISMAFTKYALMPWLIIIGLSVVFCLHRLYKLILRINLNYNKIEV